MAHRIAISRRPHHHSPLSPSAIGLSRCWVGVNPQKLPKRISQVLCDTGESNEDSTAERSGCYGRHTHLLCDPGGWRKTPLGFAWRRDNSKTVLCWDGAETSSPRQSGRARDNQRITGICVAGTNKRDRADSAQRGFGAPWMIVPQSFPSALASRRCFHWVAHELLAPRRTSGPSLSMSSNAAAPGSLSGAVSLSERFGRGSGGIFASASQIRRTHTGTSCDGAITSTPSIGIIMLSGAESCVNGSRSRGMISRPSVRMALSRPPK